MSDSTSSTESTADTTPPKTEDNPTGYVDPNKPVEEPDKPQSAANALGYDDPPKKEEEKPAEEPKKEEEPKTEEPVKDPVTGYDKDDDKPSKEEPPKTEEPKKEEDKTDEEKFKADIDEALGDFRDKEVISKFAVEHKLTKEQVKAYVELRKSEDVKNVQQHQENVKETRKQWKDELASDPEFGGENFKKSINRVEKLLADSMPNTKKALTDKRGMLPPYIMRDLLSLSKTLNPTTSLVIGDPSEPVKKEGNFLDEFYV